MKHILTDPRHAKPCSNCSTNINSFNSHNHPMRLPPTLHNEETETGREITYSYQRVRRLRSRDLYPQAGPRRHVFSASPEPLFPKWRPCSFHHAGANFLLGPHIVWCLLVFPDASLALPSGLQCCDHAGLSSPVMKQVLPALASLHWPLPLPPDLPSQWEGGCLSSFFRSQDRSVTSWQGPSRSQIERTHRMTVEQNNPPYFAYLCGKYNSLVFFLLVRLFTMILFSSHKNESFLRTGTLSHSLK